MQILNNHENGIASLDLPKKSNPRY